MFDSSEPNTQTSLLSNGHYAMRTAFIITAIAFASFAASACSTIQPTETGGPRANEPAYPVVLSDDPHRREATLVAMKQVTAQQNPNTEVRLQPVTATIQSLGTTAAVYLPKLGSATEMTEEETRESLRRFIVEWQNIIGADPEDLSLVSTTDQADGTKLAEYRQRPFRYPLRGNFGDLRIRFARDRRVVEISSTCIPDADRLQLSLAAIAPVLKPEDTVRVLSETGVTVTPPGGQSQLIKAAAADVDPRELVFYVVSTTPETLEFHLAWEVAIKNSSVKTVYLDAVKGQVLAAV